MFPQAEFPGVMLMDWGTKDGIRAAVQKILGECNIPDPARVVAKLERGLESDGDDAYADKLVRRADEFLQKLLEDCPEEAADARSIKPDPPVFAVPSQKSVDSLLQQLYPGKDRSKNMPSEPA